MSDGVNNGFKALTEFWSAQGAAMLEVQQTLARSMAENMQAMIGSGTSGTPALGASPELAQASDAMVQLWSAATTLSTELLGRLAQSTGSNGESSEIVERIANPRYWMAGGAEMDDVLSRMVDGPRLADMFDAERRYGNVMRRWTELRQRAVEHQHVLLDAWMQATQAFMTELSGRTAANGKPLEAKQAVALWAEIGNRQMLQTQRSERFLHSQRETIRASTEFRLAQAELSEHIGRQYGLPTRTEIDDVHRSLTEMRRELRRTRRELDALKNAKPVPIPAPASPKAPAKTAPNIGVTMPAKTRASATQSGVALRKAR